jgi:glycosyltransferase involved in cell wall biosynthesis
VPSILGAQNVMAGYVWLFPLVLQERRAANQEVAANCRLFRARLVQCLGLRRLYSKNRKENPVRVAQVAPLAESVPPMLYGGTERVVDWLTEELVRRGHDVTLFASGDSRTSARLVAPAPRALRLDPGAMDPVGAHLLQIGMVADRAEEFDVIHSHIDYFAYPIARHLPTPLVHTVHGRLDLARLTPIYRYFDDLALVSVSDAQRQGVSHLGVRWAATVRHGLPLARYPYARRGGNYLAFLGRIAPEKRPDLAIAAAKRAGVPLKIAAKVDPADRAYFEAEIRGLLHHPLIDFVGEIADTDKPAFLGGALALLFPIDWPEPFGLVMIEAMACGTPVIARPCGSVREVVVSGRTGLFADTLDGLVAAIKRVERIDRMACRRHVEARFTVERMADDYEAVYVETVALTEAA